MTTNIEDDPPELSLEQHRQLAKTAPQRLMLGLCLCGYAPGEKFWAAIAPHASRLSAGGNHFSEFYPGVSPRLGDRVDELLLAWLARGIDSDQARSGLTALIVEARAAAPGAGSGTASDERAVALNDLVEALEGLRDKTLPGARSRDRIHALMTQLRESTQPPGPGGDGIAAGR